MGKYTVTNAEYEQYDRFHQRREFNGEPLGDQHPVVDVSFWARVMFAFWLGQGCFLPAEEQWEFACRAGAATEYRRIVDPESSTGYHDLHSEERLAEVALYGELGRRHADVVGQRTPNFWELHDMHGNVWEWCDSHYSDPPEEDDVSAQQQAARVLRGGSWNDYLQNVRSAYRNHSRPSYASVNYGFRLARAL